MTNENSRQSRKSFWRNINAKVIVPTIGVLFGISGVSHGFLKPFKCNCFDIRR